MNSSLGTALLINGPTTHAICFSFTMTTTVIVAAQGTDESSVASGEEVVSLDEEKPLKDAGVLIITRCVLM